jgi:hypothetical protein
MPSKPVISDQVTEWGDPSERLATTWGRPTYQEWLKYESDRIGGCEIKLSTGITGEPRIALFRDVSYFNLRQEA